MKRTLPYVVFAIVYFAIELVVSFTLGIFDALADAQWIGFATPILSAPIALLTALRVGDLTMSGVAISALICALVVQIATWLLAHSVAVPAGGSVSFYALYAVGGWPYALASIWFVICPLVWYRFVCHRRSTHAPA